jgi:hypothetical protein
MTQEDLAQDLVQLQNPEAVQGPWKELRMLRTVGQGKGFAECRTYQVAGIGSCPELRKQC